jgi:4-diphosphocytidyl-2C-methyl-D-erythritol kinase
MAALTFLLELEIYLSGSGSTMFTICDNAEHAIAVATKIEEHTNFVAVATQTC